MRIPEITLKHKDQLLLLLLLLLLLFEVKTNDCLINCYSWWSSFTSTVQAAGNFIQTALESESDSDSADTPNGGEDDSKAKNSESESVDKEKAANNENAESNDSESFSWWSYSNFDKFATALKTATDVVKEKVSFFLSFICFILLFLFIL